MSKGYLQSSRRLLTGQLDMMEATTTPIWGRASTLTFFKMTDLSKIVASTLLPIFFSSWESSQSLFQSKLSPFRSTSLWDRFNKDVISFLIRIYIYQIHSKWQISFFTSQNFAFWETFRLFSKLIYRFIRFSPSAYSLLHVKFTTVSWKLYS